MRLTVCFYLTKFTEINRKFFLSLGKHKFQFTISVETRPSVVFSSLKQRNSHTRARITRWPFYLGMDTSYIKIFVTLRGLS